MKINLSFVELHRGQPAVFHKQFIPGKISRISVSLLEVGRAGLDINCLKEALERAYNIQLLNGQYFGQGQGMQVQFRLARTNQYVEVDLPV